MYEYLPQKLVLVHMVTRECLLHLWLLAIAHADKRQSGLTHLPCETDKRLNKFWSDTAGRIYSNNTAKRGIEAMSLQIRANFTLTQLLISSNVQEKKLQQIDLWFPEVNFIPTDYGNNTMKSNIKSQVRNTICSNGFAGRTARNAKPGWRGHSAVLNLPSHSWALHSGVLPFHKCPAASWGHLHCGDSWDTPGFQLLAVRCPQGFQQGTNCKVYEHYYCTSCIRLHDLKGLFKFKLLFYFMYCF